MATNLNLPFLNGQLYCTKFNALRHCLCYWIFSYLFILENLLIYLLVTFIISCDGYNGCQPQRK